MLDKFAAETSWFIKSTKGMSFVTRPVGYYEARQSEKIFETIYLPAGIEFKFKIIDYMGKDEDVRYVFNYNGAQFDLTSCKCISSEGDGICCWAGTGWYGLYEGKDTDDISAQLLFGNGDVSKISPRCLSCFRPLT